MKEHLRKRNMSRTGLLFLFCLLMLILAVHRLQNLWKIQKSVAGRWKVWLRKEEDTVLLGGMPVGIYMETDGVVFRHGENDRYGWKDIHLRRVW